MKRSRTRTQAIRSPAGRLTAAATSAAPKESLSEASTRGSLTVRHTPSHPNSHGRRARAARGISTIRLR